MPAKERRLDSVRRDMARDMAEVGRNIRLARVSHDLSQLTAAQGAGISQAAWSRLERGVAHNVPVDVVARAASVVGLVARVKIHPGGDPVRDAAHTGLLERLRARLPATVRWQTEVPLPIPGDRRAWDALIRAEGDLVGIEAEMRVRDGQDLQRRLNLKHRDGRVDHLLLVLADSRHNRAFLRSAGAGFDEDFPIPGRVALGRLESGRSPKGSAIVLL